MWSEDERRDSLVVVAEGKLTQLSKLGAVTSIITQHAGWTLTFKYTTTHAALMIDWCFSLGTS